MYGKFRSDMDTDLVPDAKVRLTSSQAPGSRSTLNQQLNPDASYKQEERQEHRYFDQNPLNLGSQSSQSAPTFTSADNSSIGNDLQQPHTGFLLSHQRKQSFTRGNNDDDDGRSIISAYSYRSDLDAYRFLREVDGRVSDYYEISHF